MPPCILVFDSGLGGLTVLAELRKARPDARFIYVADDAAFPYGALEEEALILRVMQVFERLAALYAPNLAVIACNTASTLVLPHLRARFSFPFVGTVPAIKPAARDSRTRHITVLATPSTVARDYTQALIQHYAGDCRVHLVGSARLAAYAEAELMGIPAADAELSAEIAPCFVGKEGEGTDTVVLACTHYPLLLSRLRALAPWPVAWIDPAPAIAQRVVQLLGVTEGGKAEAQAVFTGGGMVNAALRAALAARGLLQVSTVPMPFA